ncbi:hypothetical protein CCM_02401 [Cordyceps militaris CM01]|uniref:INO80 complex subunit F domain-containing protein n=2 Tax=Cordyceps militaris TaxID=73501 RepID=G3J9K4_CORMM|nr:uncharacterized protein CCM_02401 [Cordyceps militaris CM01]ATY60480.1 HMG box [Cordyceps militaris]EGX94130.1 hypothetical protein CCM_02401 [Cordyceps militaris CM01]
MAPQTAIPASLPPSVEEAYRRKCVQLKNRTNEVEEANDAARLRLTRIKRQVEKLRIERAFLLEQLSKRTSANVEDSEGSPSPPPTPKEKPLRIKRGHRKVSTIAEDGKEDGGPESPTQETSARGSKRKSANGVRKTKNIAIVRSAFDLFCDETRPILEAKDADSNIVEELVKGWEELPEVDKEVYQKRVEKAVEKDTEEKEGSPEADVAPGKEANDDKEDDKGDDKEDDKGEDGDDNKGDGEDEDVEMANYDTDDQETQMD